jgi:hypothetical protein
MGRWVGQPTTVPNRRPSPEVTAAAATPMPSGSPGSRTPPGRLSRPGLLPCPGWGVHRNAAGSTVAATGAHAAEDNGLGSLCRSAGQSTHGVALASRLRVQASIGRRTSGPRFTQRGV